MTLAKQSIIARMNRGVLYAFGAYGLWGILPVYWKLLQRVPAHELLSHRMVWSLVFMVTVLIFARRWQWVRPALRSPRVILTYLVTAAILTLNWFIYIWAVNAGFILETSLGYFINPLISVLLGMLLLKERLRWGQGAAVTVTFIGVL